LKVKMQKKKGSCWLDISCDDLLGKSLAQYMADEFDPVVCAVFDEDKPVMWVANKQEYVDHYKSQWADEKKTHKKLAFHADEMLDFLGTQIVPQVIVKQFPESSFIEIQKLEPQKEMDMS